MFVGAFDWRSFNPLHQEVQQRNDDKQDLFTTKAQPLMRVYLRDYIHKRTLDSGLDHRAPRSSQYATVYLSARETGDGRPRMIYRPVDATLALIAFQQKRERRQKRQLLERVRELEEHTRGREPGRPRKHLDHELLEYLGAYRRGDRIVLSRKMPPDERARRRYTLLNSEWRELLTVDEFISLERRVVSMRKSANRRSKAWDPNQAYAEAIQAILDGRDESSQPDMPTTDDEQVALVDSPLPAAGR
ncbi:MAG: hypothetical protein HN976_43260 [Lentisphaerae bacterium]|jgi:hypothetical protein|nr:hypothetical protein [Lentisphaerota bacterium]